MNPARVARWTGPPRHRRISLDAIRAIIGCLVAGVFPIALCVGLIAWSEREVELARGAATVAVFAIALPIVSLLSAKRARSEDNRRTLGAESDEIAVEVTVNLRVRGMPEWLLGRDEGFLCHVDGWLVFRGHRSEWAVARESVEEARPNGFVFHPPGGPARVVRLEPLRQGGDLSEAIGDWIESPAPKGEIVWPPIVMAPERRNLFTPGWAATSGLASVAALALGLFASPGLREGAIAFSVVVGFMAMVMVARHRALRRAGAIE